MTVTLIDVSAVTPQPWRNGGGQTRELIVWPATGPWQLRISRADIDADGPFSAFAGVTRWFAVLDGAGVALQFGPQRQALGTADDAICFDGALAPDCQLLDGPTQDLNLMVSRGDAVMCKAINGAPWDGHWRMRGLYSTGAGQWRSPREIRSVAAHTLLWDDAADTGGWTFTSASDWPGRALWLGFTPKDSPYD